MRKAFVLLLAVALSPALTCGDDNPEPPSSDRAELRKLQGKWTVSRRVLAGREMKSNVVQTYEFSGGKVTVANGNFKNVFTVKINAKNKPMVLELTGESVKTTSKMAFKIDKGELHLVATPRNGEVRADEDFSGKSWPLLVLVGEKSKE